MLFAGTTDTSFSENYNANLHYSFVPNRSTSLTADVSFGTYSIATITSQPNNYYSMDGDLIRSNESEYDESTDILLLSAMLDYEKSIGKFTFSSGAKYSYISTDNKLTYYNVENDIPVLDINRSNNFSYLEKIAAAYLIAECKSHGTNLSECRAQG